MTEINNCMRSLFGDFVPETNDASTKALLWHTVKDILIEEEVNMKWTKEELEKEVAGYRPFAIETAKTQLAMFKMFSGSFTAADKETLKNIYKTIDPTGSFDPNKVDIVKLNKISEFMFVTDSKGKIMGLTDAFMTIINGLGYMHKTNSGAA